MMETMELAILVGSVLVLVAIFTSLISFRIGAPLLLVFLAVGLLAGENGVLRIDFDDGASAYFIGSIALAIILFDSGFATKLTALRTAAVPAVVLATLGTVVTAAIAAAFAHMLLPIGWAEAFLVGAIISSTDAAAVFFLLRAGGITLRERVRATLEVESGSNDPIAIFMTIALIEIIHAGTSEANPALRFVEEFALDVGIGTIFGLLGGWLMVRVMNALELEAALYPILLLAAALALYALTTMLHASGFLAVYIAGLYSGNARMRGTLALQRFNNGMTWLAQIGMFLTLGLLATPSEFPAVAWQAALLALALIFVARPIAVWLCLLPFGYSRRERAFIAWVGLRGAVSILLGILPMIMAIEGGRTMFNVAFIVVVISLLVQGWSIRPVARLLGLIVPPRAGPVDRVELELPGRGTHEVVAYRVHPDSPVGRGERIPAWARPSLIVREGRSLRPHSAGRPQPGDQVYIVTATDYVEMLDRLFAAPVDGAEDFDLYGEFPLDPEATLGNVGAVYGFTVSEADGALTLRKYLRRELGGAMEQGDRVTLGAVALIVRRVDEEHEIMEVGLAVEPTTHSPLNIPLFQGARELVDMVKGLFGRQRDASAAAAPAAAGALSVPVRDPTPQEEWTPTALAEARIDGEPLIGETAVAEIEPVPQDPDLPTLSDEPPTEKA